MSKKISYVVIDTTDNYNYESYLEYCEDMDIEPADKNSNRYYEWVSDMMEMDFDDFVANMKYSEIANTPCVITGSLGLWYGRPEINPVFMDNLSDAIMKCINNMDYFKVEMINGVINVYGYHHDGTNCFEIYPLSKKGQNLVNEVTELKPYMLARYHDYLY